MYSEVPLALATTFFPIGAGALVVLAVLLLNGRFDQKQLSNIDALFIMPCLAVVLGVVAAFFGFQDQTNAVTLLRSLGENPVWIALAVFVLGVFVFTAVFFCLQVNIGKIKEGHRRLLLGFMGVLGSLSLCFVCAAHMMVLDPSWNTLATPAQIFGFALLGGAVQAVMIFEKADALQDTSMKRVLVVGALVGVVLSCGGFAAQLVSVMGMVDATGTGIDLIREASMQIAVGFFCFVAAFSFGLMAIFMKETGFHSVIAVACVFVGVFCARLVFYVL